MKPIAIAAALACACPAIAQDAPKGAPAPAEIVAAAPAGDWVAIAPSDLLVMTLAPDRDGKPRQVVIQLMPPPFSQGWVRNIRTLAAARWWDGLSINRVQDNYVVQWGDPDAEDKAKAKALPPGLLKVAETEYVIDPTPRSSIGEAIERALTLGTSVGDTSARTRDAYSGVVAFQAGWPFAAGLEGAWPVHCYGMVGVGRNYAPDTGSGAELYTVIGHAPRHLDRYIALVGLVVEGIEHPSSLPRGTGALGFYE